MVAGFRNKMILVVLPVAITPTQVYNYEIYERDPSQL